MLNRFSPILLACAFQLACANPVSIKAANGDAIQIDEFRTDAYNFCVKNVSPKDSFFNPGTLAGRKRPYACQVIADSVKEQNFALAMTFWKIGCQESDPESQEQAARACAAFTDYVSRRDFFVVKDVDRDAFEVLLTNSFERCQAGTASNAAISNLCRTTALAYTKRSNNSTRGAKARLAYKTACENGSPGSCSRVGVSEADANEYARAQKFDTASLDRAKADSRREDDAAHERNMQTLDRINQQITEKNAAQQQQLNKMIESRGRQEQDRAVEASGQQRQAAEQHRSQQVAAAPTTPQSGYDPQPTQSSSAARGKETTSPISGCIGAYFSDKAQYGWAAFTNDCSQPIYVAYRFQDNYGGISARSNLGPGQKHNTGYDFATANAHGGLIYFTCPVGYVAANPSTLQLIKSGERSYVCLKF